MGRGCQHAADDVEWRETGEKDYLWIAESDPEMCPPLSIVGRALAVRDGGKAVDGGALDSDGGWVWMGIGGRCCSRRSCGHCARFRLAGAAALEAKFQFLDLKTDQRRDMERMGRVLWGR